MKVQLPLNKLERVTTRGNINTNEVFLPPATESFGGRGVGISGPRSLLGGSRYPRG